MSEKKRLSWDEMLRIPVEKLPDCSFIPVRIIENTTEMFDYLARYTADLIKANNEAGKPSRMILPCGPKRHYPLLAELCNRERISWKNTYNIQMDEWLDWQGRCLPANHPFNMQSYLRRELFNRIDPDLRPGEDRLIFHDPRHPDRIDEKLDAIGGVDIAFGGFGFTGHIAYNEPPASRWTYVSNEDFCSSRTHIVPTNEETFIMHSHRSTGGNTRLIPPMGITVGMKDLLAAEKIRLVSDGGAWKQTIFRILCLHEPTVKFPCTFVQGHPDVEVIVDGKTAQCPPYAFTN